VKYSNWSYERRLNKLVNGVKFHAFKSCLTRQEDEEEEAEAEEEGGFIPSKCSNIAAGRLCCRQSERVRSCLHTMRFPLIRKIDPFS
jgi:hypothetical protein